MSNPIYGDSLANAVGKTVGDAVRAALQADSSQPFAIAVHKLEGMQRWLLYMTEHTPDAHISDQLSLSNAIVQMMIMRDDAGIRSRMLAVIAQDASALGLLTSAQLSSPEPAIS